MLCSATRQAQQAALPTDASCEDLQIDASLPFLNAFVQQALSNGAAPYISQQQRTSMGVLPTSRHHEVCSRHPWEQSQAANALCNILTCSFVYHTSV